MTTPAIPSQRAIFDRREIASRIEALAEEHGEKSRPPVVELLKQSLEDEIKYSRGLAWSRSISPTQPSYSQHEAVAGR